MRNRLKTLGSIVPVALALALLVGCGGGDSLQGPDDEEEVQEPAPWLDFSAISGDWSGVQEVHHRDYPMEVTLSDSSRLDQRVGTAVYYLADGTHQCTVDLTATESNPPSYVVQEHLVRGDLDDGCEEGFGMLEHDTEAGILRYEFRTDRDRSTGFIADLTRDES